jgi:hypothetical protein
VRELVELAMRGDEEPFDQLVERVGDSLHSVSRRILRDTNLAQDATQQALLDAWRHLPSLRDPDRFEAWTDPPGATSPLTMLGMPTRILVPTVGFYTHHAWVWKHNPSGIMADWNPEVVCP